MERTLTEAFVCLIIGLAFVVAPMHNVFAQESLVEDTYRLGPGDLIVIDVFGEDDLSMEVMLTDTGVINYPFLGELQVEDLTVGELENVLLGGLKGPYLVDPDITVTIKQYRSVYLTGEVAEPGGFPYQPGLTVEKAIAMAGGFTERASRNKIEVKRGNNTNGESVRVSLTDPVRPGDIITVRQSFF